jgi:hypothetical protein
MSWEKGSFGKAELEKHLGLTAGNSTYSKGSSTGVKSNDLLGEGYLSKSDTKRLLKNKQLKNAFVESGGDPDSWKTINDVDAAIDYLTKEKEAPKEVAPPAPTPPQFSISEEEDAAMDKARDERIAEYERNRATTGFRPTEESQEYLDDYKFRVKSTLTPSDIEERGVKALEFIV